MTNKIVSIVDDEKDITVLLDDALRQKFEGVEVVSFNDPRLALDHFTVNKERYTIVVSDLRMPNINGIELIKIIKESNPPVRTILMTAFDLDAQVKELTAKQVIDKLLQKPIKLDDLFAEINNQLQFYELNKSTVVKS